MGQSRFEMRVPEEEKCVWQARADASGVSLSEWLRVLANREVGADFVPGEKRRSPRSAKSTSTSGKSASTSGKKSEAVPIAPVVRAAPSFQGNALYPEGEVPCRDHRLSGKSFQADCPKCRELNEQAPL